MADKQDVWWVAMRLQRWKNVTTNLGIEMAARMESGSVGFIEVFETRALAEKEGVAVAIQEIPEDAVG